MAKSSSNKSLRLANVAKNDEFYTQLSDIEKELKYYKEHFKDKVVLCNCDDPRVSNFFHYFSYNFNQLGLKNLITICYKSQNFDLFSQNDSEKAIYLEYKGDKNGDRVPNPEEIGIKQLKGDGDFRSKECIELLKQADIVVTNPPFSLFREYVAQLIKYEKKFIIMGNMNSLHKKEIFNLLMENKIWTGYGFNLTCEFVLPDHYQKWVRIENGKKFGKVPAITWFTNLDTHKRHETMILWKKYTSEEYPKYDNLDAIEVGKVSEIPVDYFGMMGVPDTFLEKYNPDMFELIGIPTGNSGKTIGVTKNYRGRTDISLTQNGKTSCPYSRIIIKRK